jgi:signal peptidase I
MSEFEIIEDNSTADSKGNPLRGVAKTFVNFVQIFVISFLLAVFTWLFVATPHQVYGYSMEPNFHNGSFVIASRLSYRFGEPHRGDVVIFKRTEYKDYIKRVIGLPGEKVMIKNCHVYIDGIQLDESDYLASDVCTKGGTFLQESSEEDDYEIVIPQDKYLLLGDNRTGSTDSRDFGPQELNLFKGRALIVFSTGIDKKIFWVERLHYDIDK